MNKRKELFKKSDFLLDMKTKLMMFATWLACLAMTACGGGKNRTASQQTDEVSTNLETDGSVSGGAELGNEKLTLNDSLKIINTTLLQLSGIDWICGNGYILTSSGGRSSVYDMRGKNVYTSEPGKTLEPVTDGYYQGFVPFADTFFDGNNIIKCVRDSVIVSTPVFDAQVEDKSAPLCTSLKDGNFLAVMGEYGEAMAIYAPDGKRLSNWSSYIVPTVKGRYLIDHDNGETYLCDAMGKKLMDKAIVGNEYHKTGTLVYKGDNGLVGLLSINGQVLTEPLYESINTNESLSRAKKNGVYGYIDYDMKFVPMTEYEEIGNFEEGYAAVKKEGKWGFVNDKLELVIPCQYLNPWSFRRGVALVSEGEEKYLINTKGEKLVHLDSENNNWMGRGDVDFNILTWSYRDSDRNHEEIYSGNGLEKSGKKFKFARINGNDTVYATSYRVGSGYTVIVNKKRYETKLDDVVYIPGKPLFLVSRDSRKFFMSYDFETGFSSLEEIDKVIQSNLQQVFDKTSVIENVKNSLMEAKGVTDVYIFKDTYKFIGENKVYVEAAIDRVGAPMTGVYDVEVSLAPVGAVNDYKATFSWWMQSFNQEPGVEFGVEEDVVAFLQSNTFVGASGMKVNFIGSCMYVDGARVTNPLRVVLQPGNYSTAQLIGSNATLTVNGATGEVINNADGNVYKKQ